jgi:branched-chain amino acid transport system permease protein
VKLLKTKKEILKSYIINFVAIVGLFLITSSLIQAGVIDKYIQGILMLVCINIILATSLNITTGFLGQIALGHAGFMSIGAYSAALFSQNMLMLPDNIRFICSLIVGGIIAALFGIIVGIPALRLKGDYLAIITLGFGEIIRVIIENIPITGGAQGLRGIPKLSNFNTVYWLTIIIVCILFTFVRSRHGRAIMAIREDDIASEACGISNTYYKVLAFIVAAFFAGIAGGIYAQYFSILSAKAFGFNRSIEILVIVVLGGMGSLTGSIISAIGLTVLPELLRAFSQYRMLLYAILLIVVMIFKPSGLLGRYEFSLTTLINSIIRKFKGTPKPDHTKKEGV